MIFLLAVSDSPKQMWKLIWAFSVYVRPEGTILHGTAHMYVFHVILVVLMKVSVAFDVFIY